MTRDELIAHHADWSRFQLMHRTDLDPKQVRYLQRIINHADGLTVDVESSTLHPVPPKTGKKTGLADYIRQPELSI